MQAGRVADAAAADGGLDMVGLAAAAAAAAAAFGEPVLSCLVWDSNSLGTPISKLENLLG